MNYELPSVSTTATVFCSTNLNSNDLILKHFHETLWRKMDNFWELFPNNCPFSTLLENNLFSQLKNFCWKNNMVSTHETNL